MQVYEREQDANGNSNSFGVGRAVHIGRGSGNWNIGVLGYWDTRILGVCYGRFSISGEGRTGL